MSIKAKQYPVPPAESEIPLFDEFILCWGCDRHVVVMEFIYGRHGLCNKCWRTLKDTR